MPRQPRHDYAADLHRGLLTDTPSRLRSRPSTLDGRALHPGPYPPGLSRCLAYGALPLVPVVYRLISLAGPTPSGSTRPSRLCQRCFPPSPASPGSGCALLLPGCCDSPARRHSTSFNSERLTAHRRLVAHMVLGPVNPAEHGQRSSSPSRSSVIQVRTCAGDTRRTNGRTQRSDTRSAVHGPSSPPGPRSSRQRSLPPVTSKR
jgi:hypothetical protein